MRRWSPVVVMVALALSHFARPGLAETHVEWHETATEKIKIKYQDGVEVGRWTFPKAPAKGQPGGSGQAPGSVAPGGWAGAGGGQSYDDYDDAEDPDDFMDDAAAEAEALETARRWLQQQGTDAGMQGGFPPQGPQGVYPPQGMQGGFPPQGTPTSAGGLEAQLIGKWRRQYEGNYGVYVEVITIMPGGRYEKYEGSDIYMPGTQPGHTGWQTGGGGGESQGRTTGSFRVVGTQVQFQSDAGEGGVAPFQLGPGVLVLAGQRFERIQ